MANNDTFIDYDDFPFTFVPMVLILDSDLLTGETKVNSAHQHVPGMMWGIISTVFNS